MSRIFSREEMREKPNNESRSKFYKKHLFKDVKKGERKRNKKLTEMQ